MPKKWFRFKNGQLEEIDKVLRGESELARKYGPLNYYLRIGGSRQFLGTIGVTSIQKGSRQWFLEQCIDYAVDASDAAFMVLGISTHEQLENAPHELLKAEQWVRFEEVRGKLDLLEKNPVDGTLTLSDTKTMGSFGVAKFLGIEQHGLKPVFDEDGNQEYYLRDSKFGKKGDPKMKKAWRVNPAKADTNDVAHQINSYRFMLEQQEGPSPDYLRCFIVVRDGGLREAKSRGIEDKTYYPYVPRIEDEVIQQWLKSRKDYRLSLMEDTQELRGMNLSGEDFIGEAIEWRVVPPMCNDAETWYGAKCRKGYCPIAKYCGFVGDNKWLNGQGSGTGNKSKDNELEDF